MRKLLALFVTLFCCSASAADIGAIVLHGKWGSPDGSVKSLADALAREGFLVVTPEMPWSGRRLYDRTVDETNAEVDAEIAKLKAQGAKRIVLVGHSLGAAYALQFASRGDVDRVVAIAPGHRPENRRIADLLRPDVRTARELSSAGKGGETVEFTDFNSGNRQRVTAGASAFLSYFDPEGPMNMTRNVASVKPGVPVLWIVPTREEPGTRDTVLQLFKRLPRNPGTRLAEPDADHLTAPAASIAPIVEWLRSF